MHDHENVMTLVVAFPAHESDRIRVRELFKELVPGARMPAFYADGTTLPCTVCAMPLNVGPRSMAHMQARPATTALHCPFCAFKVLKHTDAMQGISVLNLRNPDSRPE